MGFRRDWARPVPADLPGASLSQTILIIEPESSGHSLAPAAIALGYDVVIFDIRPLAALAPPAREAVTTGAAVYQQVDLSSIPATVAAAEQLAATTDLVAVIPGFEFGVPPVAAVATRLGLLGIDVADAEPLRDKRLMKEVLSVAGVAVARSAPFEASTADGEKLDAIERLIGYPAVIKPLNASGSTMVRRVDDRASLNKAVARANRFEGLGLVVGERLLAEAYISGPEFSVEGYVQNGEVHVVSVTAKRLGPEPNFVEIGHVVEADLPAHDRSALADTAAQAVRALRITVGVFHAELRLSPDGPVVIEVGARLAGDRIPVLISARARRRPGDRGHRGVGRTRGLGGADAGERGGRVALLHRRGAVRARRPRQVARAAAQPARLPRGGVACRGGRSPAAGGQLPPAFRAHRGRRTGPGNA